MSRRVVCVQFKDWNYKQTEEVFCEAPQNYVVIPFESQSIRLHRHVCQTTINGISQSAFVRELSTAKIVEGAALRTASEAWHSALRLSIECWGWCKDHPY